MKMLWQSWKDVDVKRNNSFIGLDSEQTQGEVRFHFKALLK